MQFKVETIDIPSIDSYVGTIPTGFDLTVYEQGTPPEDGMVCYGFDEVGMFDSEFQTPVYAFVKLEKVQ
tara:strand:+ start:575 stop:781 length:207 start_codon:yes stop_codon:yes gene_type:complete